MTDRNMFPHPPFISKDCQRSSGLGLGVDFTFAWDNNNNNNNNNDNNDNDKNNPQLNFLEMHSSRG